MIYDMIKINNTLRYRTNFKTKCGVNMNPDELNQIIRVTKKYYLLGMKQNEIATSENISKPTVSRLINKAKKLGFVQVNLNFPTLSNESLENDLKQKFNLKHVFIAQNIYNDPKILLSQLADGLSEYINSIVEDNDIIGVSWGNTMHIVSQHLNILPKKNIKIVQLNGGVSRENISASSAEIVNNFAQAFDGSGYTLNAPSFVDNSAIATALKEDSQIKEIITLGEKSDTAIFSIGSINSESILIKAGYFNKDDYNELRNDGYVGDICSRYFKKDGTHSSEELYNRVIGIDLENLQNKNNSISIFLGEDKAQAALSAILGSYTNSIFTDEITAKKILELSKKN